MSSGVWTLALQSVVLIASAWGVTRLLRRQSAAVRHHVWTLCLGLLLVLPFWPEASAVVTEIPVAAEVTRIVVRPDEAVRVQVDWMWWVWMIGVVLLVGHELASQLRGEWLRRRASRTLDGYALSPDLAVPAVCGLWRPTVLLPEEAMEWEARRVEAVLAHERMHVLRGDLWWQLLGRGSCAVNWMNPLVWLAVQAQRVECEQACDDGVVLAGVAATDYAEHLVAIARGLNNEPILEGGLSMAKQSTLEQRLRALLDPLTSHRPLSRGMLVTSFVLSLVMLAPVAGLKLIAQTDSGVLRGVVRDASGAKVAGAKVAVQFQNPGSEGRVELTRTDAAGEFRFPELPYGFYFVRVEKAGFALDALPWRRLEGVKDKNEPLVFTLSVGGIRETVNVSGTMPPNPAPAGGPTRIRIGGNVQSAKLVNKVAPLYPLECKKEGVSGIVLLSAVIGRDGDVLSLEPVNQLVDARLRDAAVSAVKLWRYQPTLLNGNPVEVNTQIEVNFTLLP
jgi:hypothetical protein